MKAHRISTIIVAALISNLAVMWLWHSRQEIGERYGVRHRPELDTQGGGHGKEEQQHPNRGDGFATMIHGKVSQAATARNMLSPQTEGLSQGTDDQSRSLPATASRVAKQPAPTVRQIVDAGEITDYGARIAAVHALGDQLSADEIEPLYAYLLQPSSAASKERRMENFLRNEIMDKLVAQQTLSAGLADVLAALYADKNQDVVMRDYAIQHMTPIYARCDPGEKAALHQALWQAVGETDSTIAGTALIALHQLATSHEEFDKAEIGAVALRVAGDETAREPARITALQVASQAGVMEVVPIARQLAQNAQSVPLRMSAIAALGNVGNEGAMNLLLNLTTGSDERSKATAEVALRHLKKRLGT